MADAGCGPKDVGASDRRPLNVTAGEGEEVTPIGEAPVNGAVTDDESIYRRLSSSGPSMICIDSLTGEERPTSGSFMPDDDGVSVYRLVTLEALGLTWRDVVKTRWNRVVELEVSGVRAITPLDVLSDSWPHGVDEPAHPRNAAHALITGWAGLSKNERHRRAQGLAQIASFVANGTLPPQRA